MQLKDVEKLAELARIEVTEEEKKALLADMQSILGYIDQIEEVTDTEVGPPKQDPEVRPLKNVMRADEMPHNTGANTKEILAEMPDSQEGFLKVQSIL